MKQAVLVMLAAIALALILDSANDHRETKNRLCETVFDAMCQKVEDCGLSAYADCADQVADDALCLSGAQSSASDLRMCLHELEHSGCLGLPSIYLGLN